MNIGVVAEGETDHLVLKNILNFIIPGNNRYFPLQPSSPEKGTGWKGVRRWCREIWQVEHSDLEEIISGVTGFSLDILLIHVDADIADEWDLQEGNGSIIQNVKQPCPPIESTTEQLRQIIGDWVGYGNHPLPIQVVLAIPAQDTENWIFAALFPDDEHCRQTDYECIKSEHQVPGYLLSLKEYGRLTSRKDGAVKKSVSRYHNILPKISAGWDNVCRICTQADRFTQDIIKICSEKTSRNTIPMIRG